MALIASIFSAILSSSPKLYAVGDNSATDLPYELIQLGMSGYTSDIVVEKLADGEDKSILATTRKGLYIIRQQAIERFIPITGRARYVATVDDSNSDGVRDVVVTTWDTNSPNVICYDPTTGKQL